MKKIIVGMLAAIVLSCGNIESDPGDNIESDSVNSYESELEALRVEFQKEKTAWEALDLDHYRFKFDWFNGTPLQNVTVFVYPDREPETFNRWGERIGITDSNFDSDFYNFYYSVKGTTISDIYALIERSLAVIDSQNVKTVIEYNRTYHYPEMYKISRRVYDGAVGGSIFCNIIAFEDLSQQ